MTEGVASSSRLQGTPWLDETGLLLSTLRRYVQAMGGELDLVARFPNRPPVLLDHIAQEPAAKRRAAE